MESSEEESDCDWSAASAPPSGTRILLHVKHAFDHGFSAAAIRSPDTDVLVMAVAHSAFLNGSIFFITGTKSRMRVVRVNVVAEKLGASVSRSLIGLHAFTGCDSTSAFCNKGKKRGLKLVQESQELAEAMAALGDDFAVTDSLQARCRKFVCALYGATDKGDDLNGLRYRMFCDPNRAKEPRQLPPSQDALQQHVQRANYQAAIWKAALQAQPVQPSPLEHGWQDNGDGCLAVKWTETGIAPKEVLALVRCNCHTGHCSSRRCTCYKTSLPCTDVCGCAGCSNIPEAPSDTRAAEDEDVTRSGSDDSLNSDSDTDVDSELNDSE